MAKKKLNEWNKVKGYDGISVIGDKDRFSLSCEIFEDFSISINGLRVVDGKKGEFISEPAWKDKEGNHHKYARLIIKDDDISEAIIESL